MKSFSTVGILLIASLGGGVAAGLVLHSPDRLPFTLKTFLK